MIFQDVNICGLTQIPEFIEADARIELFNPDNNCGEIHLFWENTQDMMALSNHARSLANLFAEKCGRGYVQYRIDIDKEITEAK